jgi:hypothetical protein
MIGVPVGEKKSYILNMFIKNQVKIKNKTQSNTTIIFSTEDSEFAGQLNNLLLDSKLDYKIIVFNVNSELNERLTNITLAREAIRHEFLKMNSQFLAFFDSDMLFEADILNILLKKIDGFDVVYNSYLVHNKKVCNNGLGTCLIRKEVLSKVKFRSLTLYEYGAYIDEGLYFELDTLHSGFRILQGVFATSCHYSNKQEFNRLEPRQKNRWEKTVHSRFVRRTISLFVNIRIAMSLLAIISVKLYNKL